MQSVGSPGWGARSSPSPSSRSFSTLHHGGTAVVPVVETDSLRKHDRATDLSPHLGMVDETCLCLTLCALSGASLQSCGTPDTQEA